MRTFNTLINYTRKEWYLKHDFLPFKDFILSKYRRIKTRKRALTKAQIQLIAGLSSELWSSLFKAKNYFFFSYYYRGINLIGMTLLRWLNIRKGRIKYIRGKTKDLLIFNLLGPAQEILNLYQNYRIDEVIRQVYTSLREIHI